MCFSAPASFIASGGLAVAGVVALKVATKKQKLIAIIPLVFAVQQALEGFQWRALNSGSPSMIAGYLFYSLVIFWPIYVPSAVYLLDKKSHRAVRWLVVLGVAVGVFLAWQLLTQPLSIGVFGQCIDYRLHIPCLPLAIIAYLLVTCGAPMLSKRKAFRVFGAIAFFSSLIAMLFFFETFTSVWCFFMAVLSALILFYLETD